MKIKLTEPGFDKYSGFLAESEFKDGVSVEDLTSNQVNRIAAVMRVENVEEGGAPAGAAAEYVQRIHNSAPKVEPLKRGTGEGGETDACDESDDTNAPAGERREYTAGELEAIADDQGINGLRPIGETLGVKSKSIRGLIELILAAQKGAAPVTE